MNKVSSARSLTSLKQTSALVHVLMHNNFVFPGLITIPTSLPLVFIVSVFVMPRGDRGYKQEDMRMSEKLEPDVSSMLIKIDSATVTGFKKNF